MALGTEMIHTELRFAFIGCGKIAHFHADVIRAQGHKIVSVAARSKSKNIDHFSAKYNIESCYHDFKQMLDEQQLDAVVVCVTWNLTQNIIVDIINYGIPVLVEKPVALTSQVMENICSKTTKFADHVMKDYLKDAPDPFVVEIGSNDGYLLSQFQKLGVSVLGVEPPENTAEIARQAGVPTISKFFGEKLANDILNEKITMLF